MNFFKPFAALGYPILPLIPECPTCAAMRFALLSAVLTGSIIGMAIGDFVFGLVAGAAIGVFEVITLYVHYKLGEEFDGPETKD